MGNAPAANADELDMILDPIINSLASIDPTLAADATSLLSTLDTALSGVSAVDPSSALDASSALSSVDLSGVDAAAVPAQSTDFAALYNEFFFAPGQALTKRGLTAPRFLGNLTVQYDNFINNISESLGGPLLIGNGANGIADGTLAQADGGAGGIIFGDGGNGATACGRSGRHRRPRLRRHRRQRRQRRHRGRSGR